MASIILHTGREKSLQRRHPWIFSGAVKKLHGQARAGETVDVLSAQGGWLASAAYSPQSQILARVWSFNRDEQINETFFRARLSRSIQVRRQLTFNGSTAYRLVHGESDFLPGLVVDRYGDFLVCQFLSSGMEYWKQTIVEQLADLWPHSGMYERSDSDVRKKEGLPVACGVLAGKASPELLEICEGELRFWVNIQQGHKTGFYLDQRENRACLKQYVGNADVLNCFAYTGGFGVYALKYGARHVTQVESSAEALALARRNVELNSLDVSKVEFCRDDVFKRLRHYRDVGRRFDVIILDPPKFAESKSRLNKASRGYKDINWLAFRLLRPGGLLFTFSCSGLMTADLFQKIVADAALDAGCDAQIVRRLSQAADHPVALSVPEGDYLKGLVCRTLACRDD
ncbi:23S rRNA (cytosine(1962)-C(5))-methyltransferase RlmI [candidate division KSB3 bacterium]|uniref:23S rRNA (Cytosine(1962)-C(5))-methyltransferase RlmI n=1 Tax=candidate division KSB3 bacterium TaxID=2044937 RepID=A0A2G6E8H8_9BACT|nr:MAG: 23S rRNA (cytosine(1962)-C(5))-methyltransferase RlmI [candidate division KSB3 bacterium]PIE30561.1 MAG: 23S rRNA (cytosine(1962)-C(5))-methyltransferase RlmI [candidate division KSB3 bacterium]